MDKRERIDYILSQLSIRKTLQSLGDELGISRERVRQIGRDAGFIRINKPKIVRIPNPVGRPQDPVRADARNWAKGKRLPDPVKKFNANRSQAKQRGIEFRLSFGEWWSLWLPHYHQRGRSKGKKCLCRYHDAGHYEIGNVRIDYGRANVQERGLVVQMSKPRGISRRSKVNGAMLEHINSTACQAEELHN